MNTQTIKIANMCCDRCITAVKQVFEMLEIGYQKVELGSAVIYSDENKSSKLEESFQKLGFEIIKSKEEEISEKIKISIHQLFFETKSINLNGFNLSSYLMEAIEIPYKKLSDIFSKQNHKTIENYFILHRIEKAKAMIEDTDFSFSEIAFKLGYNSLSHLSRQFKAIEGIRMKDYKLSPDNKRKRIDKL